MESTAQARVMLRLARILVWRLGSGTFWLGSGTGLGHEAPKAGAAGSAPEAQHARSA